jgi:hypothetical protein
MGTQADVVILNARKGEGKTGYHACDFEEKENADNAADPVVAVIKRMYCF